MPNLYVNLPVPAGNGVGAAIDTSAFGKFKTVVVGNSVAAPFDQTVTIEVSQNAGFDFAPIHSFTEVGKKTLASAAQFMRVRVSGFVSGSADVEVGGNNNAGMFASLDVPASNGVGASIATTDFGRFKSVVVANPIGGTFSGSVHIETSEDGVVFTDCLSFTKDDIQHKVFYAAFVRVRRSGFNVDLPGVPVVDLGAVNDAVSAAAIPVAGGVTLIAGEAIAIGDVLTINASGEAILAEASIAVDEWRVIGASRDAGAILSTVRVATSGDLGLVRFAVAPAGASNGEYVFLSTVTGLGSLTPPAPPGGKTVILVGVLQGADGATTTPDVLIQPQLISRIP